MPAYNPLADISDVLTDVKMPVPVAAPALVVPPGGVDAAVISAQLRGGQNNAASIADEWMGLLGSKKDVNTVTKELAKELPGTDQGYLLGKLRDVMGQTNGNAEQAAAILRHSIGQSNGGGPIDSIRNWFNGNPEIGEGRQFKTNILDETIEEAATGALETQAVANKDLERTQATLLAAQTAEQQSAAVVAQAQAELAGGDMRMKVVLPRLEQQLRVARQNLLDLQQQMNPADNKNSPNSNQPVRRPAEERANRNMSPDAKNNLSFDNLIKFFTN